MDFFRTTQADAARAMLNVARFPRIKIETELIRLFAANGRYLAEDVFAAFDLPPFDRSTVDGYAVKAADCFGCSEAVPSFLDVMGEIEMGKAADYEIKSGQCAYVPTGGMLPKGADAVVMIEHVQKLDDLTIAVQKAVAPSENISFSGDDMKASELILSKGTRINYRHIGILAAAGVGDVLVFMPFRVHLLSTGDELADIPGVLPLGKIRDTNSYTLGARIDALGGICEHTAIINDDYEALRAFVARGVERGAIVIMSGGSSVGNKDYTLQIANSFEGAGAFVHGIAIKPGKPTILAECGGVPLIGLPGHPLSAILVFRAIVEQFLLELYGAKPENKPIMAKMSAHMHSSPGMETYKLVTLNYDGEIPTAEPVHGKSALIGILSKADGYIIIPPDAEGVNAGDIVAVHLL